MESICSCLTLGGYKVEKYAPEIGTATTQAKNADPTPEHDYPDNTATTKVYRLAEEMLIFLGKSWK